MDSFIWWSSGPVVPYRIVVQIWYGFFFGRKIQNSKYGRAGKTEMVRVTFIRDRGQGVSKSGKRWLHSCGEDSAAVSYYLVAQPWMETKQDLMLKSQLVRATLTVRTKWIGCPNWCLHCLETIFVAKSNHLTQKLANWNDTWNHGPWQHQVIILSAQRLCKIHNNWDSTPSVLAVAWVSQGHLQWGLQKICHLWLNVHSKTSKGCPLEFT